MLLTLHFELFILILWYSMDALFVYATLEWMLLSVDNKIFLWNVCPENSETDGIRMSAVYLHSGAQGLLWSSFLLHQYTASSTSWRLWSRPAKHLLECCRAVLLRPFEWPFVIVMVAFQCLFSHGSKRKSQGDKSGEYGTCGNSAIWCTDKSSLTANNVFGCTLSCRRNPLSVAHNRGQRCRVLSHKCCTLQFAVWNRTGRMFLVYLQYIHSRNFPDKCCSIIDKLCIIDGPQTLSGLQLTLKMSLCMEY